MKDGRKQKSLHALRILVHIIQDGVYWGAAEVDCCLETLFVGFDVNLSAYQNLSWPRQFCLGNRKIVPGHSLTMTLLAHFEEFWRRI